VKLDSSAFVAAPELLQVLEGHSTAISCGGDRVLFSQGEAPTGVFILSRGAVTLTMTSPAREEVAVVEVGSGSLLGLPGLIGNVPYTFSPYWPPRSVPLAAPSWSASLLNSKQEANTAA